jgi:hypothetical protein
MRTWMSALDLLLLHHRSVVAAAVLQRQGGLGCCPGQLAVLLAPPQGSWPD